MILKDYWNARREKRERHQVVRESEALHMQDLGCQLAQQLAKAIGGVGRRSAASEREKVIADAVMRECLLASAGLDDRHASPTLRCGFGNIDQRRPRAQELVRCASFGVGEETDLCDMQQVAARSSKGRLPAGPRDG